MYWGEESEDWPAWTVVAAAIETAVVVEAAEVELLVVVGVAAVLKLLLLQKQLMLLLLDLLSLLRRLKLSGGCVEYIISARHAVILLLTPTCC